MPLCDIVYEKVSKTVLYTVGAVAGTTVGTFLMGRSMWRGINKAKPIGLVVLAIVAYHTFDSYRESVDTAWSKAEAVVERRAEAAAAEKRAAELEAAKSQLEKEAAAKTAAFNAQKAADMERAEKVYQAALKDQAEAEIKRTTIVFAKAYSAGPTSANTMAAIASMQVAWRAWETFQHTDAEKSKLLDDLGILTKHFSKPVAKPKPKIDPAEVVVTKPVAPAESSEVVEARKALQKARAVCNELYPTYRNYCPNAAGVALRMAQDNYARARLAQ